MQRIAAASLGSFLGRKSCQKTPFFRSLPLGKAQTAYFSLRTTLTAVAKSANNIHAIASICLLSAKLGRIFIAPYGSDIKFNSTLCSEKTTSPKACSRARPCASSKQAQIYMLPGVVANGAVLQNEKFRFDVELHCHSFFAKIYRFL